MSNNPVWVFDAEPLLAYLADEPGADEVQHYLNRIQTGIADAYISPVQLAEISYVADRLDGAGQADQFLALLLDQGVDIFPAENCWHTASRYKNKGHSIGDSFALATAHHLSAALIVGADSDFDEEALDVSIMQFRDEPA